MLCYFEINLMYDLIKLIFR